MWVVGQVVVRKDINVYEGVSAPPALCEKECTDQWQVCILQGKTVSGNDRCG